MNFGTLVHSYFTKLHYIHVLCFKYMISIIMETIDVRFTFTLNIHVHQCFTCMGYPGISQLSPHPPPPIIHNMSINMIWKSSFWVGGGGILHYMNIPLSKWVVKRKYTCRMYLPMPRLCDGFHVKQVASSIVHTWGEDHMTITWY